jgi:hypothetical protein
MGRIFFSRLIGFVLCSLIFHSGYGQYSYYVFLKEGNPQFAPKRSVDRGAYFQEKDTLWLKGKDRITLVNQNGELFPLLEPRSYTYKDILKNRLSEEQSSFNKRYFAYVWQQFTNRRKSKQQAGVVYREDGEIIVQSPVDSAKIYQSAIWFHWQNKSPQKMGYFFLKDLQDGHITKIGTTSDSLLLHVDRRLLKNNAHYQWSVAKEPFPDLDNLRYRTIHLLGQADYEQMKNEMLLLLKTFTILGFTEEDIKEAICMDNKFCSW